MTEWSRAIQIAVAGLVGVFAVMVALQLALHTMSAVVRRMAMSPDGDTRQSEGENRNG